MISSLERPVHDAIVSVHAFLEAWFNGRLPKTSTAFEPLEKAWGSHLELITIAGRVVDAAAVLDEVFAAHGAYSDLRIEVSNIAVRHLPASGLALATFEERHAFGDGGNRRIVSAVLQAPPDARLPWRWLHVHETPLPSAAVDAAPR